MIGGRTAAGRNRGRTGGRSAGDGGGRSGRGWHGVSRNRGRQIAAVVAAAYAGAGGGAHSCRPRGQRKPPAGRGTAGTATGSHQPGATSRETGQQPPHQAGTAHHQREQNRQPKPEPTPAARPKITTNAPAPSLTRAKSERPRPRKVLLGRRPSLAGSEAQKFFR